MALRLVAFTIMIVTYAKGAARSTKAAVDATITHIPVSAPAACKDGDTIATFTTSLAFLAPSGTKSAGRATQTAATPATSPFLSLEISTTAQSTQSQA